MGERRLTYHAPVGISVCEPLDVAGVMGDASALLKPSAPAAPLHTVKKGVQSHAALTQTSHCRCRYGSIE